MFRTVLKQSAIIAKQQQKSLLFKTATTGINTGALRFYSAASTLSKDDITKRVIDVVKSFDKATAAKENITAQTTFHKDLGLDSLDTVELLVAVEEEFDIEIPDKVADELKSVGETINYISSNPEAN
ncbi:probable Acyl carrier protein, mitochondrial [Saccharomycodes ludwigii]|uniref:Acyl carrier protein n=1 Tax=Saccharomycodes ludwigii TaxID=36035 RepID=A0A376B3V9_9ASCO|nr:hypothetical protein SCDLUD_004304 [Saccharomycodes ludwigii]KAH3899987.1 hypothetical protein SCDLUD_004304 [Saccharomycodes ludwigii]SSD59368.1 probable Acyl carrier protein, mitochondrial [Saccharomycodes ludwigii]